MNGSADAVDPVAKPAHDLLCACYPNLTGAPCRCDLIAEVRADEREQAVQRVKAAPVLTPLLTTKEAAVIGKAMLVMAAAARGEA